MNRKIEVLKNINNADSLKISRYLCSHSKAMICGIQKYNTNPRIIKEIKNLKNDLLQ